MTALEFIEAPSGNFDARTAPPEILVLHYTGMKTGPEALERLRDPNEPRVSAHYMVEEDGRIFRLVAEERRAWHAGVSYWKGRRNINGVSLGIEIVNPGHEFGYRPFPDAQIAAVIALVGDIRSRWTIEDRDIVGHSDVAPDRKDDPGELFPWVSLAEAGIGFWASPGDDPGDEAVAPLLTRYGYDPEAPLQKVVAAFQRHFRPARVDGTADRQTRTMLYGLVAAYDAQKGRRA